MAVEMIITAQGVKKRQTFMRAMMRSYAKLAYEEAQAIADGSEAPKELKAIVTSLYAAYAARMKER